MDVAEQLEVVHRAAGREEGQDADPEAEVEPESEPDAEEPSAEPEPPVREFRLDGEVYRCATT